tara:strand:- start:596 stop:814 length:219 start_codon:yes stop_codon:yes gene_type:complete
MHPLINNLSDYTDEELLTKIDTLTNNYWRITNADLRDQIVLTLDTFNIELQTRQQKNKLEDNKELDNLINIS